MVTLLAGWQWLLAVGDGNLPLWHCSLVLESSWMWGPTALSAEQAVNARCVANTLCCLFHSHDSVLRVCMVRPKNGNGARFISHPCQHPAKSSHLGSQPDRMLVMERLVGAPLIDYNAIRATTSKVGAEQGIPLGSAG
jgi:hypothetical protein